MEDRIKKFEVICNRFQAFLDLDEDLIKEFLIEYLTSPIGTENKKILDVLENSPCNKLTKDKSTVSLTWQSYDSVEVSLGGIYFKPEHGESVTIIKNYQIIAIIDNLKDILC